MTSYEQAVVAQIYQPAAASLARHLPDMGQSLAAALCELARDPTGPRCDEMIHRLQSAGHAVSRLRAQLVAEASL